VQKKFASFARREADGIRVKGFAAESGKRPAGIVLRPTEVPKDSFQVLEFLLIVSLFE
jgi:hypothetical protein